MCKILTEELEWIKIEELTPQSKSVNLRFKLVEFHEEREVTSRKDGSTHRVGEAVIGDDSAIVLMTLWDDQIDQVEPGKIYEIKEVEELKQFSKTCL